MKLLVLGVSGQVGRETVARFCKQHGVELHGADLPSQQSLENDFHYHPLDLSSPKQITALIQKVKPSLVVNCAAYTNVDGAETERDQAMAINAEAPKILAEESFKLGASLIHFSTDYVYEGVGESPYIETDGVNPQNVYGLSKWQGDEHIIKSKCSHMILRTSWVVSIHGKNFVKTMLRLGQEREELKVVCDQWGAPTSAGLLADIVNRIVVKQKDHPTFIAKNSGVYNACCLGETNWFEFAEEIFRQAADLEPPLKVRRVEPVSSEHYKALAQRPKNSRLNCSKIQTLLDFPLPNWQSELATILHALIRTKS